MQNSTKNSGNYNDNDETGDCDLNIINLTLKGKTY